jgi:hypothetical protein
MAITGHAIQGMNRRYDPIDERDMLEAFAKLDAYRRKTSEVLTKTLTGMLFKQKGVGKKFANPLK